ncbi:efflux RND transporter permease subunit [Sneathiella aquimaris]|uniref:efflux RND transporter permease subunit n=1 Tax=Sneathiella aquimaris TaxID=2599305 RepID=UPI00146B340C|nr:MMPL family transporter [Sneathiella aquimaris]
MISDGDKSAKFYLGGSFLAALLLFTVFSVWVDLKPKITEDFFFGSKDPAAQQAQKIRELFPSESFLLLSVGGHNIYSAPYYRQIKSLSDKLAMLPGTNRLISLSNGPATAEDARKSPFWRPLLINRDETASLILVFVEKDGQSLLVRKIDEISQAAAQSPDLTRIGLSGMPYIAEQIRQSLVRDVKIFSSLALVVFITLMGFFYRSAMIALGSCISGLCAIFMTLIVLQVLGQPIGILTANLSIIVYVLVQSQIIYLTNNWLREDKKQTAKWRVRQAVGKTFKPSCWCALTTLLGFLTLLFVSAEPLRQLGAGGIVAVLSALACCYFIFPSFLVFARIKQAKQDVQLSERRLAAFQAVSALVLLFTMGFSFFGLWTLNTDPSLLSYFKKDTNIETGLRRIDENGGSSPLLLVVSLKSANSLDNEEAYKKLWTLHKKLAEHSQVGTVLSLPALLAEANNHPFAFLLPWREIVTLLSLDMNQSVVENFLTNDREQALFLIRMKEQGRESPRLTVINDIRSIVEQSGFRLDLTGGVYFLQAKLADLVGQSLISGVLGLLLLFVGVSWIVTRQIPMALVMGGAASMIPFILLGGIGQFSIPVDIISAPAISVTIGLAVDALIHLAMAVKRKGADMEKQTVWLKAIEEQGPGIITSAMVISIGFLIFSFSDFPPTVRFGLMVVCGSLLAVFVALAAFPLFARFFVRQ